MFDILHRALDRRQMLTGGAALASTGAALSLGLAPRPAQATALSDSYMADWNSDQRVNHQFLSFPDLRTKFRANMRMHRTFADEANVLYWYHFMMFTIKPGNRPEAIIRWEGMEYSRQVRLGDDIWRVHGHNLSYPRDIETNAFTDSIKSPFTGETLVVPPMKLIEDPGMFTTPWGIITLDKPDASPDLKYDQYRIEDDLLKVDNIRAAPKSWPALFVENSVNWVPKALFDDPDLLTLPAHTAGSYVFPWPAWMKMDGQDGHMLGVWNGKKIRGIERLPRDFLARAEADAPNLLAIDPEPFTRPYALPDLSAFTG